MLAVIAVESGTTYDIEANLHAVLQHSTGPVEDRNCSTPQTVDFGALNFSDTITLDTVATAFRGLKAGATDQGDQRYSSLLTASVYSDTFGGGYEASLSGTTESFDWFDVENWVPCDRSDIGNYAISGSSQVRIAPEQGQVSGDVVGIEIYVITSQDEDGATASSTATLNVSSGGGSNVSWQGGNGAFYEYEGVGRVGDVISFTADVNGALDAQMAEDIHSSSSGASLGVYIYDVDDLTMESTVVVASGPDFGPYLPGVKLDETFRISVPDPLAAYVDSVAVEFADGSTAPIASREDESNTWVFTTDVGAFETDTDITVTVSYEGGAEQRFVGTIDLLDDLLQLELKMRPGQFANAAVDIDDVRLISQIPLDQEVTLEATVSGLPAAVESAYSNLLDVILIGGPSGEATIYEQVLGNATSQESLDGYAAGEYRLVIKAANAQGRQFRTRDVELSAAKSLSVIDLPTWMTPLVKNSKFEIGGDVGLAYANPQAAGFSIDLSIPNAGSIDLSPGGIFPTGIVKEFAEVFATLSSSVNVGLDMKAVASLVDTVEGRLELKSWRFGVELLGTTIVEPQGGMIGETGITGTLSGPTLALNGLDVDKSIDLKQQFGLGDDGFVVPFGIGGAAPIPLPIPGFVARAEISGEFRAKLSSLYADVAVHLREENGGLVFAGGSSFYVAGSASASLALSAQVGLGFNILEGFIGSIPIATAAVSGKITAGLLAGIEANVSGSVISPSVSVSDAGVKVNVSYNVDWKVCVFESNCQPGQPPVKAKDQNTAFGIPTSIDALEDAVLEGVGDATSTGFPGVTPTVGDAMGVLGPAGESDPPPGSPPLNGVGAPVEVARLTLRESVDAYDRVQFDLNAMASTQTLTPGIHWLEVRAVSPSSDVLLSSTDLASLGYAANDNPLGFASGWNAAEVVLTDFELPSDDANSLQFRLISDGGASGEVVSVALDAVTFVPGFGGFAASIPGGDLTDGVLDFGADTAGNTNAAIEIENSGTSMLVVTGASVDSPSFLLPSGPQGLAIAPGGGFMLPIEIVDPSVPATATLTLTAEDPAVPPLHLTLSYDGPTSTPIVVEEISINGGAAQRSNVSEVRVTFSAPIDAEAMIASGEIAAAAQIVDVTQADTPVALTSDHFAWHEPTRSLIVDLTTDGHGGGETALLPDGRFELRLHPSIDVDFADTDGAADGIHRYAFHRLETDLDGDATVGLPDLAVLQGNLGRVGASIDDGDLTEDGLTSRADAARLAARWGASVAALDPPTVPSPAGSALAVLATTTRLQRDPKTTMRRAVARRRLASDHVDEILADHSRSQIATGPQIATDSKWETTLRAVRSRR